MASNFADESGGNSTDRIEPGSVRGRVGLGRPQGVLIHAEALVEQARHQVDLGGTHAKRLLAKSSAVILRLLRACVRQHLCHFGREHELRVAVEEQVPGSDASTDAREDCVRSVIRRIAVEVAAGAVLATCQRRHSDLQVHVVRPPVHVHLNIPGQVHVHNFPLPYACRLIDELAIAIVRDSRTAHLDGRAKGSQCWHAIDNNGAVLNIWNLDSVPLNEGAGNHDLVRGSQAEGVLCAHIASLDFHLVALHNPIFAVSVEGWPSPVKSDDVRIAPECAIPLNSGGAVAPHVSDV